MSTTYVPREGIIKLKPRSVRSTKAIGSKDIQKPDPAAVVAKTEFDHHIKAESLRRTNEKIENIERCIATDTGPEVAIRQTIVGSQKIIDDVKRKRAELDKIIHEAQGVVRTGEEEMKKSKDQKRDHHSVEMEQLVKEQAVKLEELKPAEKALYVELAVKLSGYQKSLFRASESIRGQEYPNFVSDNVPSSESEEDYDTEEEKYKARSASKATTRGRAAAIVPKAVSASTLNNPKAVPASTFNKGKKRTAEVVIEKKSYKSSDKRKFLKED